MSFVVRCVSVLVFTTLVACGSPEAKVAAHLQKARDLLAQESFDKAKIEAKNAIQIEPKNAEAHLILAKVAWREQNVREAFPHLQMAIEGDPKMVEARLRLGDLLAAAGDAKAAGEQVDAVKKLAPDRADLHLLAGKVLILQDDTKGGEAEIDKALAIDPAFVDAITSKASLLSMKGDNAGAMAVINEGLKKTKGNDKESLQDFRLKFQLATGQEKAYEEDLLGLIKDNPGQLKYRYQLLDLYAARRRVADQGRVLREIAAADPKNEAIKVRLASFLVSQNDPAGAEKLLKDSIARNPDSAELRIGLGDFYRYAKRSPEAMAAYREVAAKWADTTPEGQQARNRIVAQHVLDGNMVKAQEDIAAILKAAPDNAEALQTRAFFAFLDRRYDDAIADLRTVLRRQRSPDAALLLARCYLGIGDVVVAKDTYRRVLDEYPGNETAAKELTVLLSDQGETAAAEEILRQYVAVRPGDPGGSAALFDSMMARNDLGAAEAEARRMAAQPGTSVLGTQALADVLLARGSTTEALATYKAVLEKDPNQPDALNGLVKVLLATNRPDEAISFLERYPKGDVAASVLLAKVYGRQGDIASARQVLDQAVEQHPQDNRPYLALAALSEPDSPQQVTILQQGLKATGGDPVTAIFLASIAERQGRYEDAIGIYEEAFKKAPADIIITNNLASLLLDHRTDKASLARALALARPLAGAGDPATLDTLGWAYYRNGDFANAVRQLERAVAKDETNAQMLYHLGKAYAGAGNREGARQYLNEAVERGKGEPFVADARASLARLGS